MKSAVVVGSGPNGMAAAVTMALHGYKVKVFEGMDTFGGGTRTQELTLPGFAHDLCSAVHPLGLSSPFFTSLSLEPYGLEWLHPQIPFSHSTGEEFIPLYRSVDETAAGLGVDEKRYKDLFSPLVKHFESLIEEILQPIVHFPKSPIQLARFGIKAALPADLFAQTYFSGEKARALFMGVAAHANCSLSRPGTTSVALMLMMSGHARGWPVAKGGSQAIANALKALLQSLGGEVIVSRPIADLSELPQADFTFFDLVPSKLISLFDKSGEDASGVSSRFSHFRHGPGVYKMDWALNKPIPWLDPTAADSGTLHLGGLAKEIILSEEKPEKGLYSNRPYILMSQPSLFDPSRAPLGQHTAWAYCHVPNGSEKDMSTLIEDEIEQLAPNFKSTILAKKTMTTREIEMKNPNLVGGDISGGAFGLRQLLFPQRSLLHPYLVSKKRGFYICSSSTPPGPGVHGMCGRNAAHAALGI